MLRKFLDLALVACIAISLCGCGAQEQPEVTLAPEVASVPAAVPLASEAPTPFPTIPVGAPSERLTEAEIVLQEVRESKARRAKDEIVRRAKIESQQRRAVPQNGSEALAELSRVREPRASRPRPTSQPRRAVKVLPPTRQVETSPPPAESQGTKVWVNTKSGVYHYPGARWYGNTKRGEYMSESETRSNGYRSAENGQ